MNLIRLSKIRAREVSARGALLLLGSLAGCSGFSSLSPSHTIPMRSMTQEPATRKANAMWRRSLMGMPFPSVGCFEASYPSLRWQRIACSKPSHLPDRLPWNTRYVQHAYVGDGNDYTLQTNSKISMATGSFPNVTGVESLHSPFGHDSYSLQLNSSFFPTAACKGMKYCAGWEQFVFLNVAGSEGALGMEEWLVQTNPYKAFRCPPNAGWWYEGDSCLHHSHTVVIPVPYQPIRNLRDLSLTGAATSSGDSVYLAVGSKVYGMKNYQKDGITDLAPNWKGAEFNIFGPGSDTMAQFNSGSTITVSLEAVTANKAAPIKCVAKSGTTGETNNLTLVSAPSNPQGLQDPSILFTESNAPGRGSASCDAVPEGRLDHPDNTSSELPLDL